MPDTKKLPRLAPKKLVLLLGGGIVLAGGIGAIILLSAGGGQQVSQTVFKETSVARGDLTVGVNESGSASISAVTVAAGFETEIESVSVRAGQKISEGDEIARLYTDSIQAEIDKLTLEHQKASLALKQARLEQQLKKIDASYTYQGNDALSDTAQYTYDATVGSLKAELDTMESKLDTLLKKIGTIEGMIDDGESYDTSLSDLSSKVAEKERLVAKYEDAIDKLKQEISDGGGTATAAQEAALADLKNSLEIARQELSDTTTEYNLAVDDAEEDMQVLLEDTQAEYDLTLLQYNQKRANVYLQTLNAQSQQEQSLTTSKNAQLLYNIEVAQLENTIASSELSLKTMELTLGELKESLADATVKAPCEGTVTSVSYQAGDTIKKGAVIVTISNSSQAFITISLAQEDIGSVQLDKEAVVTLDAFENTTFDGTVYSISTSASRGTNSTVSYSVVIKLSGDTSAIYEGMTGDVTIVTKQKKDVLYVSNRAVYMENNRQYVKIKDADGNPTPVEVTTGFSDGTNVEVTSGLSEGDVALIESVVAI